MSLTDKKREKLIKLTSKFMNTKSCKIREWAQYIGNLVAACPAIKYSPLYIKSLERCKFLALQKIDGDYEGTVHLSREVYIDLNWWIQNLPHANNPILNNNFSLEIFSDASLTGWGAFCNTVKAHGYWSRSEKENHINYLELKAILYGLQCFANNHHSCEILLRVDNTTAISYVNKMGSIQLPKLLALSKEIWQWCEKRDIFIFASYIKSSDNVEADEQSRVISEETEWAIGDYAFEIIRDSFGPFDTDLFASTLNTRCKKFFSWMPDPKAMAVDAFTVPWSHYYFYAFPPFSLILRVLRKICRDRATGVLVIPYWPTQPWFPLFNELRISNLVILEPNKNLLSSPFRAEYPTWKTLTLAAAILSGKRTNTEE